MPRCEVGSVELVSSIKLLSAIQSRSIQVDKDFASFKRGKAFEKLLSEFWFPVRIDDVARDTQSARQLRKVQVVRTGRKLQARLLGFAPLTRWPTFSLNPKLYIQNPFNP